MARLGQFRRDTLANWRSQNPILADGEFALVASDSANPRKYNYWVCGNGTSTFSQLPMAEMASSIGITGITSELGNSSSLAISQKGVNDLKKQIDDKYFNQTFNTTYNNNSNLFDGEIKPNTIVLYNGQEDYNVVYQFDLTTNYIKVELYKTYSRFPVGALMTYDENKNFIGKIGIEEEDQKQLKLWINNDINVKYIRCTIPTGTKDYFQFIEGIVSSENKILSESLDISVSFGKNEIFDEIIPYEILRNYQLNYNIDIKIGDSLSDVSSLIDISRYKKVQFISDNGNNICEGVVFYDKLLGIKQVGDYNNYVTSPYNLDIPYGYQYMQFVLRRPNGPINTGHIILKGEINKEIKYLSNANILTIPISYVLNNQTPSSGNFIYDELRDRTDFIDITRFSNITIKSSNGNPVCCGAFLYKTKNSTPRLIGDLNTYNLEYSVNIPKDYSFIIFMTRRPGMQSITNNLICIGTNLTKDINIILNQQPPKNGLFISDNERDRTNFIDIQGANEIEVKAESNLIWSQIYLYRYKGDNPISIGPAVITESFKFKIPNENFKYAIFMTRRPGMTDIKNEITIIFYFYKNFIKINNNIYNIYQNTKFINLLKNELFLPNLQNKKAIAFGSSNVTQKYGIWFQDLCDYYKLNYKIYGVGAATYPDLNNIIPSNSGLSGIADELVGQSNCLINQVKYKIEQDLNYIPNLIFINSGMNEAGQSTISVGDLEIVMNKSLDEIINSTDVTFGKNTLYGSMRWVLETLMINYPNAQIIGIIPWQCYEPVCTSFFTKIKQQMENMYNRMGIPIINAFNNGGFYSKFEPTGGGTTKYTLDGIHVKLDNVYNFEGRIIQNTFICKEVYKMLYDKIDKIIN